MEAGTDTSQVSGQQEGAKHTQENKGGAREGPREHSLSKVQPHLLLVLGDAGFGSLDVLSSGLGLGRAEDVGSVVMIKTLTQSEPAHTHTPPFTLNWH